MRQLITRVDDELADAVRRQAQRTGQSVNAFVNRLLRVAVTARGPGPSTRQMWKAAAVADGRLAERGRRGGRSGWEMRADAAARTPPGYAARVVREARDERGGR
ncbi:MAG: hypothetical protein ACRDY3_06305 [Acidimicrobiales bacterium]